MTDREQREALWVFREEVYACFDRRRDALFDLLDALLVTGAAPSFVHLSLAALFRRGWGSADDALAAGRIDEPWLRWAVAAHPPDDGAPLYAIDTSVWVRSDAKCSPQRGFYHSSSRQSAGQPIVAGWSYAWLAQLSLTRDSWTAQLDVRRVPVRGDAHAVAAAQIRELVGRQPVDGPAPVCVFDAGHDIGKLAQALGDLDGTRVAVLVRLRGDRCFYAEPEPRASPIGRPLDLAGAARLHPASAGAAHRRGSAPAVGSPAGRPALTPARVRQGFPALLGWLGTPATAPKPCGRSPGRPAGARPGPAPRYPALKKVA